MKRNEYDPNPATRIVIASAAKQSHFSEEIATHLSGARNYGCNRYLQSLSLYSGMTSRRTKPYKKIRLMLIPFNIKKMIFLLNKNLKTVKKKKIRKGVS